MRNSRARSSYCNIVFSRKGGWAGFDVECAVVGGRSRRGVEADCSIGYWRFYGLSQIDWLGESSLARHNDRDVDRFA